MRSFSLKEQYEILFQSGWSIVPGLIYPPSGNALRYADGTAHHLRATKKGPFCVPIRGPVPTIYLLLQVTLFSNFARHLLSNQRHRLRTARRAWWPPLTL